MTANTKSLPKPQDQSNYVELILIVSMMMSLTALAIDAILPALSQVATDLGVADANANDRQLIISVIFLGQALGQLFFGPLSDKTGRKPSIYLGYGLFIIGSLISTISLSFPVMLVGRALQGIGIAAPRAVSLALVRDQYEGSRMASIMSFAMSVFVIVPALAPSFGQAILAFAGWRYIFVATVIFALITVLLYAFRIPETLAPENRVPFSGKQIIRSTREIMKIRSTVGFILAAGLIFGVFIGYLNSSQQIFQDQYGVGESFPLYFAGIALSLGAASIVNARLVMRYGMTRLINVASIYAFVLAVIFLVINLGFAGNPPLWMLVIFLILFFFGIGLLFGNINSLAMQPLGRLAGIGAGVVGAVSTLISMLLGTVIGQFYDGTLLPLVAGMVILSGISLFVIRWAEQGDAAVS